MMFQKYYQIFLKEVKTQDKFHINKKGTVEKCSADKRCCPYGSADTHYYEYVDTVITHKGNKYHNYFPNEFKNFLK